MSENKNHVYSNCVDVCLFIYIYMYTSLFVYICKSISLFIQVFVYLQSICLSVGTFSVGSWYTTPLTVYTVVYRGLQVYITFNSANAHRGLWRTIDKEQTGHCSVLLVPRPCTVIDHQPGDKRAEVPHASCSLM